jgi:uncharacterized protein (TIGR02594 family)
MKLETKRRAAILLCSVALAILTAPALAKPAHKAGHRHHAVHTKQLRQADRIAVQPTTSGIDRDDRYPAQAENQAIAVQPVAGEATQSRRRAAQSHANSAFGGFTSNSLVSEARKYIGSNPTGRGSLWCGAFMDLVLKRTGHHGGGNLARAYASYGARVSGPQVGAIAVMNHHVGVVSGVDPNGNPIIVSGNHNRTVAESVYPRGRITAYVMPGG